MNLNGNLIINTYKYNASTGYLDRVGVIDNISSLTVEMKYGDFGTATITMPYTTAQFYAVENADCFTVNLLGKALTAYLITSIERSYKESGDIVKVSAEELKALTKRRVELYAPTYTEQDVTGAIKKIINDNIVNPTIAARKIYGAWLNTEPTITADYTAPEQYDVCSSSLRTICSEANCNYYATIGTITGTTTSMIVWSITQPTDRTSDQSKNTRLLLTLDRDYLSQATVSYDKHNIPTVMVVSYGDTPSTAYYQPDSSKQKFNRYESYVSASSEVTTSAKAKEKGQESYKQYGDDVTVKIKPSHYMLEKLFEEYNLGDIGTFVADDIERDVQLTAMRFTFENGDVSADYTFNYDRNTITDALRRLTQNSRNKKK